MLLETITEIIEKVLSNENYKNTIYDYIKSLIKNEYLLLEEPMGLTISNYEMSEYLTLKVYGPSEIVIEMIYCDKKERFTHNLNIYIDQENNIYVKETKNNDSALFLKEEEYQNNKLFYCCELKDEKEKNTSEIKEIVFNEENIVYTSIKKLKNSKIITEDYSVGKVATAYTFEKEDNNPEYTGKIITPITKKQYIKATAYVLNQKDQEEKENKIKKLINIIKPKNN